MLKNSLLISTLIPSLLILSNCQPTTEAADADIFSHGRLVVSENQRFLVFEDGTPFFYLGDTAWELFHRLDRDQADYYLENRASLGFTVIQADVLAEENGLIDPNPYGEVPLYDLDPARPNVAYFEVRMDVIRGPEVVAWWYNPRNGSAEKIGMFSNTGTQTFSPPDPGENLNWVLVLDDASIGYGAPGMNSIATF